MELAIETRALVKKFGEAPVLHGLDLQVPRGIVYGFLGKNGAGKTTAMRLLMGLLEPTQGEALVLGRRLGCAPPEHRERVAYVSQEARLPGRMTLAELAAFQSRLYGRWDGARARQLARSFGLAPGRPLESFSGGERRKAAILLALSARPEVLLLDEPAAGLDPVARRELIDALVAALEEQSGLTVFLSTHLLADVERLAEVVGILDQGKLVAEDRVEDLQAGTRRIQIVFAGEAVPAGFTLPGALRGEATGPVYTAVVSPFREETLRAIETEHGARVQTFPLSLEEVFVEIVERRKLPTAKGS